MISVRRLFLSSLTLVFGAFNVSLAMFRLDRYNDTWITISMGLGYFLALLICVQEISTPDLGGLVGFTHCGFDS